MELLSSKKEETNKNNKYHENVRPKGKNFDLAIDLIDDPITTG